jgi:RNA polymerase sigma-70 factor, ECF subfamily
MKQDEHAIIIRIMDGDRQLYRVLVDRHKEGVYRHCFKFVRDEALAEDLAQEAFIKAYLQLGEFDGVHAFSTWLYKIATNLALAELRRHRPFLMGDDELDLIASDMPETARAAIYAELYEAIQQLPSRQKEVVARHYFEGKQYSQIAREMKTTTGSVKGWMSRARKQLREILS